MSRVGGIEKVKRESHELEFASASLVPIATIRSAVRHLSLEIGVPQKPVCPSSSGGSDGKQPLPISVWATGISSASASGASSAGARDDSTPPPAYRTGRSADASASTICSATAASI